MPSKIQIATQSPGPTVLYAIYVCVCVCVFCLWVYVILIIHVRVKIFDFTQFIKFIKHYIGFHLVHLVVINHRILSSNNINMVHI